MTAPRTSVYALFHLNLAYSSIDVDQRHLALERCYWPLLEMARELDLPLGVEVTGLTLERAHALDPSWVEALRLLVSDGPCELVGSGYAQIIGPLVPAAVNQASLRLGNEAYDRLLGVRPTLALVNEQAFSAGLVGHYLAAGYEALVMEWNNPARYHPEWDRAYRYLPQRARGLGGKSIPLVWNEAIAFQKVQRYAHGELEMREVLDYLEEHIDLEGGHRRALSLYGNDAEVFDFRPGRYDTEEALSGGEWDRLGRLFESVHEDERLALVRPSEVLALLDEPEAGNLLLLGSAEQPVPVKKQVKYNVTRWAVTGRDDLGLNTACHRILRRLEPGDDESWRDLCRLWSSDLRTHITEGRWTEALAAVGALSSRVGAAPPPDWSRPGPPSGAARRGGTCRRHGRWLTLETDSLELRLNCRRGLALDSVLFRGIAPAPLVGTLPHGYFEDISLGADFYTGHTVVEVPGSLHAADLNLVEPTWERVETARGPALAASARVPMPPLGTISKTVTASLDRPLVGLHLQFDWSSPPRGAVHAGLVTLLAEAFDPESLFFAAHNGGLDLEPFLLEGRVVEHSEPASALVTARHGVGSTGGIVELGDASRVITIEHDPAQAAVLPMVVHRQDGGRRLLRVMHSLGELDDTCAGTGDPASPLPGLGREPPLTFSVWVSAR